MCDGAKKKSSQKRSETDIEVWFDKEVWQEIKGREWRRVNGPGLWLRDGLP